MQQNQEAGKTSAEAKDDLIIGDILSIETRFLIARFVNLKCQYYDIVKKTKSYPEKNDRPFPAI